MFWLKTLMIPGNANLPNVELSKVILAGDLDAIFVFEHLLVLVQLLLK